VYIGQTISPMKISHLFLSLVSISLTVISARASSLETKSETVQLPTFTIEVPRRADFEVQIAQSLNELRATARTPIAVKTEIPLVAANTAEALKSAPVLVIAKS